MRMTLPFLRHSFDLKRSFDFCVCAVGQMSMGRQEAFDIFLRDYAYQQAINENKQVLKQRYKQAKALGEKLNTAKQKISKFGLLFSFIFYHLFSLLPQ